VKYKVIHIVHVVHKMFLSCKTRNTDSKSCYMIVLTWSALLKYSTLLFIKGLPSGWGCLLLFKVHTAGTHRCVFARGAYSGIHSNCNCNGIWEVSVTHIWSWDTLIVQFCSVDTVMTYSIFYFTSYAFSTLGNLIKSLGPST